MNSISTIVAMHIAGGQVSSSSVGGSVGASVGASVGGSVGASVGTSVGASVSGSTDSMDSISVGSSLVFVSPQDARSKAAAKSMINSFFIF